MLRFITKKLFYGLLVLAGVVVVVFFLFQGFGDPSRLVMGQSGDSTTQSNIRKELYLDQPKWKQFFLYLNDVSPLCFHSKEEIKSKQLRGLFVGGENKVGLKIPYLRKSYQSKREVGSILMQALPGTLILAIAAMIIAVVIGIPLGVIAAVKTKYLARYLSDLFQYRRHFRAIIFHGYHHRLPFWFPAKRLDRITHLGQLVRNR